MVQHAVDTLDLGSDTGHAPVQHSVRDLLDGGRHGIVGVGLRGTILAKGNQIPTMFPHKCPTFASQKIADVIQISALTQHKLYISAGLGHAP